jgi:hypothetical protein
MPMFLVVYVEALRSIGPLFHKFYWLSSTISETETSSVNKIIEDNNSVQPMDKGTFEIDTDVH